MLNFFCSHPVPLLTTIRYCSIVVNQSEGHFYPMVLTEVEELDLPQDPCNEEEKVQFSGHPIFMDYLLFQNDCRFQACVSESMTRILGCKSQSGNHWPVTQLHPPTHYGLTVQASFKVSTFLSCRLPERTIDSRPRFPPWRWKGLENWPDVWSLAITGSRVDMIRKSSSDYLFIWYLTF